MSERRTPPSVFRSNKAGLTLLFALFLCIALVFMGGLQPAAASLTFPPGAPVQINTATGSQLFPGNSGGSCSYLTYMYGYWVDSSNNLYVASSTDGVSWNTPQNLTKLTGIGTFLKTTPAAQTPYQLACNGQYMEVVWTSVNGGAVTGAGKTNFIFYMVGTMSGGVVSMNPKISGPQSSVGHPLSSTNVGTSQGIQCAGLTTSGQPYYCTNIVTSISEFVLNNVVQKNWSSAQYNIAGSEVLYNPGNGYMFYQPQTCDYATSADGVTWPGSTSTPTLNCLGNHIFWGTGTTYNGNYYVAGSTASNSYVIQINQAGTVLNYYLWNAAAVTTGGAVYIVSDGTGNFVIAADMGGAGTAGKFAYTNNAFTTISTVGTFSALGNAVGTSPNWWSFAAEPYFSSTLEAFGFETVTTSSSFIVYETVFGIPQTSTISNTVTIGQCPAKNTATATMVNNTEYFWTTNYFSQATINNIQTEVASVNSGHAASETLYMGVYFTSGVGSVSASNPFLLAGFKTWVLSATSAPQLLTWASSISTTLPTGTTVGIALLGNSKILINDSSLTGMSTASGTGGLLTVSITSLTSSATQLFFCASMTYQSVVTTTVTSTSTSTVTSGGTATTTISSTTTLTSLNANAALGNSVGIAFVLLILLAPAFAIAVPIGVYTKSPIGVGLGFVAGLAIGALLGNQGGLIPFSVLAGMMVVIVLLIVGFLFALKSGQG